MNSMRRFAFIFLGFTAAAMAAEYPNKPIRIVTGTPGGGLDLTARVMAPGLTAALGQQIIVDNRTFAVAPPTVAKALPDGYTLLLYGSPFWLAPFMRDDVSYDPIKDFAPIALTVSGPNVLVVNPSVPAKSIKELIALAKANPGKLNFASSSPGAAGHLATELFKATARIDIVHVPYKGASQALTAVLGNEVQLMVANSGAVAGHLKSGKLRALGVTSARPSELFPGLPTVAASGLPGYESVTMFGMFAPAGTPAPIVNRLHQDIVKVLKQPDVKDRLLASGVEVVAGTPQQLTAAVKAEMSSLGKVIKDIGLKGE